MKRWKQCTLYDYRMKGGGISSFPFKFDNNEKFEFVGEWIEYKCPNCGHYQTNNKICKRCGWREKRTIREIIKKGKR